MDKKIKQLRIFFRVSNIAFETVMAMGRAFGGNPVISPMHKLHQLALEEIEKEIPDLEKIDFLLSEMEKETENKNLPNFPNGGITPTCRVDDNGTSV